MSANVVESIAVHFEYFIASTSMPYASSLMVWHHRGAHASFFDTTFYGSEIFLLFIRRYIQRVELVKTSVPAELVEAQGTTRQVAPEIILGSSTSNTTRGQSAAQLAQLQHQGSCFSCCPRTCNFRHANCLPFLHVPVFMSCYTLLICDATKIRHGRSASRK